MNHWEVFTQFGLAGIIFGGFLLVLRWVFQVNHKILDGMDRERDKNQLILQGFADNIRENRMYNKEFHAQVKSDHANTQREHKEMIEILGRINGYRGKP